MLVLRQPDQRSCGASVLVRARMLAEPAYDAWLREAEDPGARWADEVLRTHRRTNRLGGGLPWPRALGTLPWAIARELPGSHRVRWVLDRERAWGWLAGPAPTPLYVGNKQLPRHVVLVLKVEEDRARIYDPASGAEVTMTRDRFVRGDLAVAGWPRPWCVVVPCRD